MPRVDACVTDDVTCTHVRRVYVLYIRRSILRSTPKRAKRARASSACQPSRTGHWANRPSKAIHVYIIATSTRGRVDETRPCVAPSLRGNVLVDPT